MPRAVTVWAFLLLLAPPAERKPTAEKLSGCVTAIQDGDTLTATDAAGELHRVRLAGIDAPELAQPYGPEARAALVAACRGKDVEVHWRERDRYGRILGDVFLQDGGDGDTRGEPRVNVSMVREGHAWQFRRYDQSDELWRAEFDAREAGKGLWDGRRPEPVAPWDWRATRRRPR